MILQDLLPSFLPNYTHLSNLHPRPTTIPIPYTYPYPMDSQRPTISGPDQHRQYRSGSRLPVVPSLKRYINIQLQLVNDIGKFNSDNSKRSTQMAYVNLRQSRSVRRDLAALHSARSHIYRDREFGFKGWYSDKPGIARRIKNPEPAPTIPVGPRIRI